MQIASKVLKRIALAFPVLRIERFDKVKSTLSEIEDLDYASAVTRMNKEMMALEAAMGSFAKISGMTLFDYIRS